MKCFSGIKLGDRVVPCRQCINCRVNTGRKWTGRIMAEWATTKTPSWFATLTYSDDDIPVTNEYVPNLQKSDLKKFIRRQTRRHGKFRYYAIGEYGNNTLRPHYHLALFFEDVPDIYGWLADWKKGFISASQLTPERAGYLANYTTKKLTKPDDPRLSRNQEPEFRLSSRHPPLGSNFVEIVAHHYATQGQKLIADRGDIERTFRVGKKIYPLDEWMLKKIRTKLNIPILHDDRLGHPEYASWHSIQDAEIDSAKAQQWETQHHAKKIANATRSTFLAV